MTQPAHNWSQYWDTQSDMGDDAWRKNCALFLSGSRGFFPFSAQDRVLDIGSGPGFLADALQGRVRAIHCVDTSRRYVEAGRKRLAGAANVSFTLLGEDTLDFSFLGQERFSRIVCASVIQYFKHTGEVERLIAAAQAHALPGALMLIADIPEPHPFLKDLAGLVRTAWRQRYLLQVLRFTLRSLRSDYSRLRKTVGLLTVRREDLEAIVARLGVRGEWIDAPLTLNDSRRHYLIRF
jgi:SAM-dependent methyltransferase